jgi:hypothetical protein
MCYSSPSVHQIQNSSIPVIDFIRILMIDDAYLGLINKILWFDYLINKFSQWKSLKFYDFHWLAYEQIKANISEAHQISDVYFN